MQHDNFSLVGIENGIFSIEVSANQNFRITNVVKHDRPLSNLAVARKRGINCAMAEIVVVLSLNSFCKFS
jgi:hypothetical protein